MIMKDKIFLLPDTLPSHGETKPCIIYDARALDEVVPAKFNAVTLTLDGRSKGDLNWEKERAAALRYISQGLRLFWQMELGLFSELNGSLSDQVQYLALGLSLEHFRESLWKEFHEHSIGISLLRASVDFSFRFPWDDIQEGNLQGWLQDQFQNIETFVSKTEIQTFAFSQLSSQLLRQNQKGQQLLSVYCRDVACEYLGLLVSGLPDRLPIFVLLDDTEVKDSLLLSELLNLESYGRIRVAFANGGRSLPSKNSGIISRTPLVFQASAAKISVGVCLSSLLFLNRELQQAIQYMTEGNISFRIIPEAMLTTEWDGLDYLLIAPESVSSQGWRKLRGFCAAGGTVVSCETPIATIRQRLPHELTFSEWSK